jgi:spore maturation protein SpmA
MSDYSESQALDWKWVFISMGVFFVAQIIVNLVFGLLGIMTLGIGFILFLVAKPVTYFIGGYVTGRLSPGITIREPAIGAVIISVAGAIFDSSRVMGPRIIAVIISAVIAYAVALWGARIGEGVE